MLNQLQGVVHVIRMVVQRSLTTLLLILLYIIGFGLTSLFLRIFKPGFLSKKFKADHVSWCEASGYEIDHDDNLRQA